MSAHAQDGNNNNNRIAVNEPVFIIIIIGNFRYKMKMFHTTGSEELLGNPGGPTSSIYY